MSISITHAITATGTKVRVGHRNLLWLLVTNLQTPVECDPYATHFKEDDSGFVQAMTRSGEYTAGFLRLNREECLRFRSRRTGTLRRLQDYTSALDVADMPEEIRSLLRQTLTEIHSEWRECYSLE
jgi:hypothetical protein